MIDARTHRTARAAGVAALLAGLVAALAACGGGSDRPAAGPTSPAPVPTATGAPAAVDRPNILVIEADDMRTDELRWMPNVRKFLGGTGLTFENSFAPYPLCCPSRASFLTGRYAHNHHVLSHVSPFGFGSFDDSTTVATRLHDAGYQTALVGKYLNGYGEQAIHGTDEPSLTYVPPGWTAWHAGSDHKWRPGEKYDGTVMHGGTYAYFHLTQNIDGTIKSFPGRYNTSVLARQTRNLITRFSAAKQPWFVWFTPIAPHHGSPREPDDPRLTLRGTGPGHIRWVTPARPAWVKGRFDDRITHGLGTPAHGSAEADVSDKPKWLRRYPELNDAEKAAETTISRQRAEALYVLDREIGKTLATLRKTGQYDRTVLAFTSDNGYYLGEHRKRQGKIELHEPSLRVPFLISGPGIPHGRRYDPITTVDLAPTFSAFAGIGRMPKADGVDLTPVITGGDRGWDRPVVTEGRMGNYPTTDFHGPWNSQLNTRGIRLGRWKLTEYSTDEKELYDLERDPLELQNLAADPAYADVLARMQRVWLRYKDCAGAACSAPLPADLRTSVAETRQITEHETDRVAEYYGG
ncbi:sulfatase family protein [Marmoricola sp. RAF53]|uniref:sulfatase family protein n=1 Tax=Marmoricola sp. RAF53 TaxID=3233059 RepID=UPI003F9DD803